MAENISSTIFQFKIKLKGTEPRPVWRRIQVPAESNYLELHSAIQCSMGWFNEHLWEFQAKVKGKVLHISKRKANYGTDGPSDSWHIGWLYPRVKITDATTVKLSSHFKKEKVWILYLYDLGDKWLHRVELEKILPKEEGVTYPRCIAGEKACPPENCGSISGYKRHLEIYRNPRHPEYNDHMAWYNHWKSERQYKGGDPGEFDPNAVVFKLYSEVQPRLYHIDLMNRCTCEHKN